MNTAQEIINRLSGRAVTLGWDVVIAYDRKKINTLLEQQYVEKVKNGENFPLINWENQRKTLQFKDLQLGVPLISFENSTLENSRALATIEFISGAIIEFSDSGQIINYKKIEPSHGYGMVLTIDLMAGTGSVEEQGRVIINLNEGAILDLHVIQQPPAEVVEFFRTWLMANKMTYELGKLDLSSQAGLVPRSFRIRTQRAPEKIRKATSDEGNGAVLLFVATNYNPTSGTLPAKDYPWLIPEEYSGALLIGNKCLFKDILKPNLDQLFDKGEWTLKVQQTDSDQLLHYLEANSAYITDKPYMADFEGTQDGVWTGRYKFETGRGHYGVYENVRFPINGMLMKPAKTGLQLSIDSPQSHQFNVDFGMKWFHCANIMCGYSWFNETYPFYLDGKSFYQVHIDPDKEVIYFTGPDEDINIVGNYSPPAWWQSKWQKHISDDFTDISSEKFKRLSQIKLPEICMFAVNHLLFPGHNTLLLKDVYLPGDMVIFGDINPSLTAFRVTPLKATVVAKGTQQFKAIETN
ncbi:MULTISPECIES: hypothetical protein [Photorhabdus]|uniref:Uncharacterized protein n=2 Tax=Photorhabdus asymbiotica TaxID=291112 RepID=B6VL04_PHOAA|nr:hypothetical protein [Photorhabdus asymbiotica]RKS65772.1 hypothetical protein BDD30_0041 [Photorhabdus asymbiotica]CAQ84341.1 conserved hypothetical protein [Photorhabdus asymbiotica]CAR66834.1 Conserved Hypothetical Protein [Photorhabdus asymbiotica subsp. asymbiotica ATCC 43949]